MNVVNYSEYSRIENEFFKKHTVVKIHEQGNYKERSKHYICEDGAELWEDITIKTESKKEIVKIVAYGQLFEQEVEVKFNLLVTEFWNTDNSISYYYIEKF